MKSMAPADRYRLLVNTVTPRPIAWVVSRNADGLLNAAPYGFFNVRGSEPPLCVRRSGIDDPRGDWYVGIGKLWTTRSRPYLGRFLQVNTK